MAQGTDRTTGRQEEQRTCFGKNRGSKGDIVTLVQKLETAKAQKPPAPLPLSY